MIWRVWELTLEKYKMEVKIFFSLSSILFISYKFGKALHIISVPVSSNNKDNKA